MSPVWLTPLIALAAAAAAPPTEEERQLARQVIQADLGRYIVGRASEINQPCTVLATPLPNWSGFPVERCVYRAVTPERPLLVAYLLNPDLERLATWIASGCIAAGLRSDAHCRTNLAAHIRGSSGSQFPVSGLVDESDDEETCPSHLCYFTFRDGVAVDLRALESRKRESHQRVLRSFDLSADEAQVREGPFSRPGSYARIASTSVSDLVTWLRDHPEDRGSLALSPQAASWVDAQVANGSPTPAWPDTEVIRVAYQLAWHSDRNILIDAWAWANRTCLATAEGCPL